MAKLYFKMLGIIAVLVIAMMGIGLVTGILGTAGNVASIPTRVINETVKTENVIHNYEWFHDVYNARLARVDQYQQFKSFYDEETDQTEKRNLRIELANMQMSCRTLTTKYNSNSSKINVSIFKGTSLPDMLDIEDCN
jgi:hypothetical protein